jgi:hypothetical protein
MKKAGGGGGGGGRWRGWERRGRSWGPGLICRLTWQKTGVSVFGLLIFAAIATDSSCCSLLREGKLSLLLSAGRTFSFGLSGNFPISSQLVGNSPLAFSCWVILHLAFN